MERKQFTANLKALNGEGTGVARIAMLGPPPDRDGDILEAGVLGGDQQIVPLLTMHDWSRLPAGKAAVSEEDGALIAQFKINMDMAAGRALHSALTFDQATPPSKMEWSFGYLVKDAEPGLHEGARIRRLRRIELIEVSPVIKGAGRETMTLAIKSDEDLAARSAALVTRYWETRERHARLEAKLLAADFERLTERVKERVERPFGYVFLPRGTRPEIERAAARFAGWAIGDSRLPVPEIKLFRQASAGESPDFRMACKVIGTCFRDGTIGVHGDLDAETLAETTAHETAHALGADESAAEAFGRKFVETTYREMIGGSASRRETALTWEQGVAFVSAMRYRGMSTSEILARF